MQLITPNGTVVEGDSTLLALKVAPRPAEASSFQFTSNRTGLLTGVAASGVVWALRNAYPIGEPTYLVALDLIRIRAVVTTPFTTAQEWGLSLNFVSGFSSNYTTNVSFFSAGVFKYSIYPRYTTQPGSFNVQSAVAATAGMTGATATVGTQNLMADTAWELAAGATVPRSKIEMGFDFTQGTGPPVFLAPNEGIAVVNTVLMGAAGVIRLTVEAEWRELDQADL